MAEQVLDIPVSDLPFEAGKGFVATVSEDGIAHIVVTVATKPREKAEKTLGQWARENKGILKGAEKHAEDGLILEAILDKHAPELLG